MSSPKVRNRNTQTTLRVRFYINARDTALVKLYVQLNKIQTAEEKRAHIKKTLYSVIHRIELADNLIVDSPQKSALVTQLVDFSISFGDYFLGRLYQPLKDLPSEKERNEHVRNILVQACTKNHESSNRSHRTEIVSIRLKEEESIQKAPTRLVSPNEPSMFPVLVPKLNPEEIEIKRKLGMKKLEF